MIYSQQNKKLRLVGRNEGKLKSYESCDDVRAWSHDLGNRDRYLREWIKTDMPTCVMPVHAMAGFLRTMSRRIPCRASPRCHPDCKSKVLLDNICTSCTAMKECLKNEEIFENYFIEEELETSHWPCERCLEALKSIKMFWRIMVDRIFNVNITKKENELFEQKCRRGNGTVEDVAKAWRKDLVQQAMFVKTSSPRTSSPSKSQINNNKCYCDVPKPIIKYESAYSVPKMKYTGDGISKLDKSSVKSVCTGDVSHLSCKSSKQITTPTAKVQRNRVAISDNVTACKLRPRKHCRCTSVRVKTVDMACDTADFEEKIKDQMQGDINGQKSEIEKLRKENMSLKHQLGNVCIQCKWKSPFYLIDEENVTKPPKPYEAGSIDSDITDDTKNIDSEMLITIKNCKNENYKHVSLLQVLHKTNAPVFNDLNLSGASFKKEDPLTILAKVQDALGNIVNREIGIATAGKVDDRQSDIDASFQTVNTSRPLLYCSSVSSS